MTASKPALRRLLWLLGARKGCLSCINDCLRQHSANDGLKPGPQTVPKDFTEGADERHLGSSANLPLIMSAVPTPHGTTRASLFLSAASPSPEAQAFPQEPGGLAEAGEDSAEHLNRHPFSPPASLFQSPDSTCHQPPQHPILVGWEYIKVVKTMGTKCDRPGFDSQPATHYPR